MIFKRGSFGFKLFSISVVIGLVFALTSVFANNYFINKIILRITEERVSSIINYIEPMLKTENKNLTELNLTTLFNKDEINYIALYDAQGKPLSGIGNFDNTMLQELPIQEYSIQKSKSGHYNFIKRVSGIKLADRISDGYILISLDLKHTNMQISPINLFRMLFFISIILLLMVFVYFTTKNLTLPFEKALNTLRMMVEKGPEKANIDENSYDEIKEILSRFQNLLSSLNSMRFDLLSSEERLKTLLNKTRDIILMLDEKFRIEYASSTFTEITGIDTNSLDKRLPISEFMPLEDRRRLLPFLRKVLRNDSSEDLELRMMDKNGNEVFLLTSWIVRESSERGKGGIILLGKDITEHKRVEEILKKKTEALETILFSLSHDLKSPIFTLKGMTQLFKQQYYNNLNEQGQHFIDRINENILKLERLISNMLDIVRYERQVFKTEEVNLNEIIGYLRNDIRDYIKECNAEVRVINRLPIIKGDKDKIYIVFKNLFENALKYRSNRRRCQIAIESKEREKDIELIFEDNGIGIESKYIDKLFKPFSRAITPSDDAPAGYGIGLAIVKGILDAHNADIMVESSYGEWTRFRIFFDKSMVIKE